MDFAAFLSNLGNNLGFGLTVTLIGIAIVFLGLTILIGLIKLMENATANLGKGGKKAKGKKANAAEKSDMEKLGVYEGAGYSLKGVYRPCPDCRMRSNNHKEFCPACQKALKDLINFYTK